MKKMGCSMDGNYVFRRIGGVVGGAGSSVWGGYGRLRAAGVSKGAMVQLGFWVVSS